MALMDPEKKRQRQLFRLLTKRKSFRFSKPDGQEKLLNSVFHTLKVLSVDF